MVPSAVADSSVKKGFLFYKRGYMKFKANTRRQPIDYEKDLVKTWKNNKTFEKSVEMRPKNNSYVFYDGPPFITGVPHHGTLLSSIVKDVIPRYQTMKGKRVERVWGWDCHGLPAENFVEKKLGITDRHEIGTTISLENYITTARESMVQTSDLWEDTVDRIGRWVDFKGAYKTMGKDYMESVWWAFKQLYDKGKIYEGERVLMYDTNWATPLSKAEVTMDAGAYVEVTDPSVFVKFKLQDSEEFLLAWTTTPWTLPANTGLAINKLINYVKIKVGEEVLILAKDNIEKVLKDEKNLPVNYEIIGKVHPNELIGKSYEPLFEDRGDGAHKIWNADFVTTDAGTGIVHIAPAYGEDDFSLAKDNVIPVVHVLDEYGNYIETEWKGKNLWEVNKLIAKTLKDDGRVWRIEYIRHEYPHNPRTGKRLIYRAHPSWFFDIDGQRTEMLEENHHINWFPEHIKYGRFENTIVQAPDWNISRDRFWATAMPVWKGVDDSGNEHIKVVGSYAELKELSGIELEDYHRPWVDDIKFVIGGVKYSRVDKVLDCWFESGSMPFAQFHYPFENVQKFEENFPGDFIVEYIGQVRAWFYYVHAVNVALFGHNAFKNVIVTGNIQGNDGRKMSKSVGNFTDPTELMDKFSADSLRFTFLDSPVLNGEDFALQDKFVGDIYRKLSMIWNMYDFFTMYAEVDNWEFDGNFNDPSENLTNPLDIWIVSRIHLLINEIEKYMDNYDIPSATKLIFPFIEDASNWYVRRSRRRFWKSGATDDKSDAYKTLHYVLINLAKALAPFTPFLSEELYQKLTGQESVHLTDWPKSGKINQFVIDEMTQVREYVNFGLGIRAKIGIKVRQPLSLVEIPTMGSHVNFKEILSEELNVKEVRLGKEFTLDTEISQDLKEEGLIRELIRHIQNSRKESGLNIDDRIYLTISSQDKTFLEAVRKHTKLISDETLAIKMLENELKNKFNIKIDSIEVNISMEKA